MHNVSREQFMEKIKEFYGEDKNTITRKELGIVANALNTEIPYWITCDKKRRVSRGVYSLNYSPALMKIDMKDSLRAAKSLRQSKQNVEQSVPEKVEIPKNQPKIQNVDIGEISLVPQKVKGYVPFGHYNDVRSVIKSGRFYPTYITGLSGNGKTMMIEQACSDLGRECIRVNITKETDEDSLIGGFRLINGETVWQDGPVVLAMRRGAILLLDEVDLGDAKLLVLQTVMEGNPLFLKKINKVVYPQDGFNIFATANTKGQGSYDGKFIGTNIMNEAFLERFKITFEQQYPESKVEQKILTNVLQEFGITDNEFVDKLVKWADVIRRTYYEGAVSDIISTRRLVGIVEAYAIFGQSRDKAIALCLNRFDNETKDTFMDLYAKIDEKSNGSNIDPFSEVEVEF